MREALVPPVDHVSHNDLASGLQQQILPNWRQHFACQIGLLFVLCSCGDRLILWVMMHTARSSTPRAIGGENLNGVYTANELLRRQGAGAAQWDASLHPSSGEKQRLRAEGCAWNTPAFRLNPRQAYREEELGPDIGLNQRPYLPECLLDTEVQEIWRSV
jgi:hypothetical protein